MKKDNVSFKRSHWKEESILAVPIPAEQRKKADDEMKKFIESYKDQLNKETKV